MILNPVSNPIRNPIRGFYIAREKYIAPFKDYMQRAEAEGGSFDLTGTDPAYTEDLVKDGTDAMVRYLLNKPNGFFDPATYGTPPAGFNLWDNDIAELYPLAGVTFAGLMQKLKYISGGVATLTNNNFVAGDLVPAGSGAGLVGNRTTKYLGTGLAQASVYDSSVSAYIVTQGLGSVVNATVTNGTNQSTEFTAFGGTDWKFDWPQGSGGRVQVAISNGYLCFSGRASNDREAYKNGASAAGGTTDVGGLTASNNNYELFRYVSGMNYGDHRLAFAHIGTGLTDDEAAYLSWVVNGWATLMGFNTYANP